MHIPKLPRPIRYAMVGGNDAFIAGTHGSASRLDGDYWKIVGGAFSSNPAKSKAFGQKLGLSTKRCYNTWTEMIAGERSLPVDIRAEVIINVATNDTHAPVAIAAFDAGFHVFSEKPAARNAQEARAIRDAFQKASNKNPRIEYGLAHNYTGYGLIQLARLLIQQGKLGTILAFNGKYKQDWLTDRVEEGPDAPKLARWRTNPKIAGAGGLNDIGTHVYQLIRFLLPDLRVSRLLADVSKKTPGRLVDDHSNILTKHERGVSGNFEVSQVAVGNANNLAIEINGTEGSLWWSQEDPNTLRFCTKGGNIELIRGGAGMPGIEKSIEWLFRRPGGHPDGFIDAFSNLYTSFALIVADANNVQEIGIRPYVPGIVDAVDEMIFVDACLESSAKEAWVTVPSH